MKSSMSLLCGSSYCNLECNGISICQDLKIEENIWSIKCVQTSSCQSVTATCTKGKSCLATCDGISACQSGKFYGKWNDVDCKGISSCQDLTIHTSENVKCSGISSCQSMKIQTIIDSISCWDTSSCQGLNTNCADEKPCFIHCEGISACQSSQLNGNWNKIVCKGLSSCQSSYVEECSGFIECKEMSACQGLTARCTDGKSWTCYANCQGISACQSAKLYGLWNLDCSGMSACQGSYVQNPAVWIGPVDLTSSESNSNIQRPSFSVKNLSGSVQRPSSAQTTIFFAIFLSIVLHL